MGFGSFRTRACVMWRVVVGWGRFWCHTRAGEGEGRCREGKKRSRIRGGGFGFRKRACLVLFV